MMLLFLEASSRTDEDDSGGHILILGEILTFVLINILLASLKLSNKIILIRMSPLPPLHNSAVCPFSPSPALYLSSRGDVVICLSTTVRNDTLQDVKEQRVSLKCRKQLRVEELEMVRRRALLTQHRSIF